MLQRDLPDPDFLVEQREQFDSQPGLFCGNEVRPAVANLHVIQRDLQAGEEAEPHLAADPDFHPQRIRSGRFQAGLVGIGVHEKVHGCRDDDEEASEPAAGVENDFLRF